jgi:hypothetical protein
LFLKAGTGEIVEVIQGGKKRTPKSKDFGAACFWLQRHGYKPVDFKRSAWRKPGQAGKLREE